VPRSGRNRNDASARRSFLQRRTPSQGGAGMDKEKIG
jgi:hypothetical protein